MKKNRHYLITKIKLWGDAYQKNRFKGCKGEISEIENGKTKIFKIFNI